jgi:hypothetical protein
VVLLARDEQHLREVVDKIKQAREQWLRDPRADQFPDLFLMEEIVETEGRNAGHLMALGVYPGPKGLVGKPMSDLPLLRLERLDEFRRAQTLLTDQIQQFDAARKQAEQQLRDERALTVGQRFARWWKG